MSIVIGNAGNQLEMTIPSRADVNWDAIMQAALTVITTHNHDGVNNGTSIAVVPSSVSLTSGNILVGNASNVAASVAASGDVTNDNTGAFTVNTVGTSTAADIHASQLATAAATNANTASTIVKRDGSGNFIAGTVTAALTGTASGNLTLASPAQHGLLLSGAANATTVLASAGTNNFLVGTSGADPAWNTPTQTTALLNTVTQSLKGLVASAGQLLGTSTNDSASAGNVGEVISQLVTAASPVTGFSTTQAKNIATITLTPGDWDISCLANAENTTSTDTITSFQIGIGTATGTLPTDDGGNTAYATGGLTVTNPSIFSQTIPPYRVTVASGTSAYWLVGKYTFAAGAVSAWGNIRARRQR